ncbi:hypothetical protein GCM10009560_28230 [Nonomuraea longicatena]|uniref:WD40 repeat domain-containing protein n=2 Tax=Nonomuraea longicatena TaxID=83682 RepID=A0ABN1PED5_9ACTN
MVPAVAFRPGGHTLAIHDKDGEVRLCRVPAVSCRTILKPESDAGGEVVFTRDGTLLAAGGYGERGKEVRLWDARTGEVSTITTTENYNVEHLAFDPTGRTLATSSYEGWDISFWDVRTGRPAREPIYNRAYVTAMAYSPDGRTLATTATQADTYVRLWNTETGKLRTEPLRGHIGVPSMVAFSPDGRLLVTGAAEVIVWDVRGRRAVGGPLPAPDGPGAVTFTRDGRTLAVAGGRRVSLWQVSSGTLVGSPAARPAGYADRVRFSPDGRFVATWSDAGFELRDAATFRREPPEQYSPPARDDPAEDQAASADGRTLLKVNRPGEYKDGDSTLELRRSGRVWTTRLPERVEFALSPDGTRVAAGNAEGGLWLWDAASSDPGQPISTRVPAKALAFSRDGTMLAAAGADNSLWLWNAADGTLIKGPLTGHSGALTAVAFSPDGKLVATGSDDRRVRLWDVATGMTVGPPLTGHDHGIAALDFAPDSTRLATVSNPLYDQAAWTRDSDLRRWDLPPTADPVAAVCAVIWESLSREEWSRYVTGVPYARACA